MAWLIYRSLEKWRIPAIIAAGIGGSLTNTLLVLGMIGILGFLPWAALPAIVVGNGLAEAAASAIIVLAVVSIWQQIAKDGNELKKPAKKF